MCQDTTELFSYSAENNLVCDCRLLWLYELRNRTKSGFVQKSLDNLNCELRERNFRPEQVFLLRLHYENFDCQSPVASTEFSVPVKEAKYRDRSQSNPTSSGGFRVCEYSVTVLVLVFTAMLSLS